ncbi:hypothetical protein [Aeromonas phage 13AhydR10PP]|nr:hypothetical protein [Aeromonas phage 13AhydR10PP]AWH15302.1 hypothetical protein [Aeromonas phage 14AhydR10PP]
MQGMNMKNFAIRVAELVCACLMLLAISTAITWRVNQERITEYRELAAKMDAMAEYLSVEYVDVLPLPEKDAGHE